MRRMTMLDLVVAFYLGFFFVMPMVLVLLVKPAHGHEAPSGWKYPDDCCGGHDCREIACTSIKSDRDGGVTWTGLKFEREMVKVSGDAQCHVCISYDWRQHSKVRFPHCIFLSPMW